MNIPIDKGRITVIQTLIGKLKLKDQKDGIIKSYTNQRTPSVAKMYLHEALELLSYLNTQTPAYKMKGKILAMAHELRWHLPGTRTVDMDHLNSWCKTFGRYKKALDDHTEEELPHLVTQYEAHYKSVLKTL